jgi:ribosomal-protein-alanine N-acetyltransferase
VTLRPHRSRDARAWSEVRLANERWLGPWEPTRPQPWRVANDVSQYPNLLRSLKRGIRSGDTLPWVITYEGAFAGQITLSNVVRGAFCSASVGYWVDGRVAGRGIMPTALAMVVDHGFTATGLHRIEVNIRPENTASRRVVEKLGFREEALHARFLHIDGAWRDHVGYALTIEDVAPTGLVARWRQSRTP